MRILINAGPTREYFDSVRFISNPSSGKMGYALARQAAFRGHGCILVSGPVSLAPPEGVRTLHVTSAAEMFDACVAEFESADAAILTAAVCDYRPLRKFDRKLRKQKRPRQVTLVPTPDILAHLGARKGRRVVIGFAMEDHDQHAHAESKLRRKHCDAMVLNGLANVGSDDATIEVLTADGRWSASETTSKEVAACRIIHLAETLRADKIGRGTRKGSAAGE